VGDTSTICLPATGANQQLAGTDMEKLGQHRLCANLDNQRTTFLQTWAYETMIEQSLSIHEKMTAFWQTTSLHHSMHAIVPSTRMLVMPRQLPPPRR
jgi:hypothetical protein